MENSFAPLFKILLFIIVFSFCRGWYLTRLPYDKAVAKFDSWIPYPSVFGWAILIEFIVAISWITQIENKTPDGYKDGKPYRVRAKCIKSEIEYRYGYGQSFDYISGDYKFHWGIHPFEECVKYRVDTIYIKK